MSMLRCRHTVCLESLVAGSCSQYRIRDLRQTMWVLYACRCSRWWNGRRKEKFEMRRQWFMFLRRSSFSMEILKYWTNQGAVCRTWSGYVFWRKKTFQLKRNESGFVRQARAHFCFLLALLKWRRTERFEMRQWFIFWRRSSFSIGMLKYWANQGAVCRTWSGCVFWRKKTFQLKRNESGSTSMCSLPFLDSVVEVAFSLARVGF